MAKNWEQYSVIAGVQNRGEKGMMKRQKGISLTGFVMLLFLLGVVAVLAVKIGPIYLESFT